MIIVIMNEKALYDITYGLYLISTNFGGRDNACISNTAVQAASSPKRITLSLNKSNYTTELISKSGVFTVSVISKSAPFELFKRFGFRSGRDSDKFAGADFFEDFGKPRDYLRGLPLGNDARVREHLGLRHGALYVELREQPVE